MTGSNARSVGWVDRSDWRRTPCHGGGHTSPHRHWSVPYELPTELEICRSYQPCRVPNPFSARSLHRPQLVWDCLWHCKRPYHSSHTMTPVSRPLLSGGIFRQTLPELVTPLKGHSLYLRSRSCLRDSQVSALWMLWVLIKLLALVYDSLPSLEEGAGKRRLQFGPVLIRPPWEQHSVQTRTCT